MNEMIEKAAKAYADATGYYVDFHRGLSSVSADKIRDGVRAVIETLRDPSEPMTRALYEAGANNFAYQSAIDAALKDENIAPQ